MKKKVISAALAGTLAVSLLSACGASNEPQNISDVSSAASSEATSTTASSESTGDAAQELTFVLNNIPDGLDPSVTNNSFAQYVLINCFEGLVTYDSTGTLVPGNAESWDISDDGLTYTFHLRDGLKWSDGSDLTAEDYVYTIQRVLTPATAAQYVSMATDYIKNAQEYYDGTATADDLGVKALDDKTLEITLIQPTSYFIDILSMWTFSPVQKATVEANGDKWSTEADTYICNGPFKIASMSIKGEFTENGVNNPLKHIRGALSMARDDDFDTAGTQFFVVHKDAAKLDGRYAAFGEMESGFDVLDAIANQPTYGPETWNKPKQMPVITKITIED